MININEDALMNDVVGDYGDGTGWIDGNGNGAGAGECNNSISDFTAYIRGHGSGSGAGDGTSRNFGGGYGIEVGNYEEVDRADGVGMDCRRSQHEILLEIGVPEQLHKFFFPLTPSNMLVAQDFVQSGTQEQRDAVLGMLELGL